MIFKKQIPVLILLLFAQLTFAQNKTAIRSWVDRDQSYMGEPFSLTIEVSFPQGATLNLPQPDTIPHFEFAEAPVIDSANSDGTTIIKGVYKLISFDSGHWVIPSFILQPGIMTDTIPVDIVFTKNFDPNQDYHDIKDIIEVKPEKKKKWLLYGIAAGLLLIAALIYFLRKKKPAIVVQPALSLNAYEEAMKELDKLQRSKTDAKMFHSGLTNIFRLYVYRKKGILSLQKTTDDLVLQIKNLGLDKEQFDKLAQSLRLSDFVKFAKYIPSADDDKAVFDTIRNAIINIEKSEADVLPSGRI